MENKDKTVDSLREFKEAVDAAIDKKLHQTEGKIKDQSQQISQLLEKQDKLEQQLKVAEESVKRDMIRKRDEDGYRGPLTSSYAARGFGLLTLALCGNKKARDAYETEYRAMGEESASAGAALVPTILEREIIVLQNQYGVVRRNMRIWPLASGGEQSVPKLTGELTVYNPAEGASITASDLAAGAVALNPRKWALLTAVSSELDEDAVVAIGELIAQQMAYSMVKKEDQVCFLGDASATYFHILGLLNSAAAGAIKSTTSDDWEDITVDDTLNYPAYIQDYAEDGAAWYLHRTPWYRGFVGAALGAGGVYAAEIRENAWRRERTWLGYPVNLTSALPGAAAATTAFGVFGDLNAVAKFGQRRGFEIARSDDVYFATDQIALRGIQRVDFAVHDVGTASAAGGYVVLKSGASD